jgi:hypothetical protein
MPKYLSPAWVKNVYSLRILGGITSDDMYTGVSQNAIYPQLPVHKPTYLSLFIPVLSTQLSTRFFANLPPLIRQLYPQSTVPTIKRTK